MNDFDVRLKNKFSGKVYSAASIGAADTLVQSKRWNEPNTDTHKFYGSAEAEAKAQAEIVVDCWKRNKGDGFWIEGVGRVMVGDEWENLFVPFDKLGREILVGDVIVYAMRNLTVSELKVEKIGNVDRYERTLHGTDLHTKKKTKNSYPSRCIKVSP